MCSRNIDVLKYFTLKSTKRIRKSLKVNNGNGWRIGGKHTLYLIVVRFFIIRYSIYVLIHSVTVVKDSKIQRCNVLKEILMASDILNLHSTEGMWQWTLEVISVRTLSGAKLHRADEWRLMSRLPGLGELTILLSFGTQLLGISNKSTDTVKDISKFLMAWPFRRLCVCDFCPFHCYHPVAFP